MSAEQPSTERVTLRVLNDKLDDQSALLEQKLATNAAEQKTQHTITRAMVAVAVLPNLGKALALLGVTYLQWTQVLPWHF